MTEISQIWKCEVCGNIVEVLHDGADSLVCCGQPMGLKVAGFVDAAVEKHQPVINGHKVSVGSVLHPMEDDHYIEWIEATDSEGIVSKIFLSPGDEPFVEFCFVPVSARAYCNLHGLWKD